MTVAGYHIHIDALLARIIFRWHWKIALALFILLTLLGLVGGHIPPIWRGTTTLTVQAAPGATVEVDGRPWPRQLYGGQHAVTASLPDGRRSWATLTLQPGQALTLTLPTGLAAVRERAVPPPAPGMQIAAVEWVDGAWRVQSVPHTTAQPTSVPGSIPPTATPAAGQTLAIRAERTERLATLDAYGGLADQLHLGGSIYEAVYRPNRVASGDRTVGNLEVRGWGSGLQTLPISAPLTLVRFAPDGTTLLLAEQVATGGSQVSLIRQGATQTHEPVIALPGVLRRVAWREDSSAAVLWSEAVGRLTLTLVRLRPTVVAAVVADLPVGSYAAALVPLTWDATGLLWVAPNEVGGPTLWHAPLTTLIPEQQGTLDARGLTVLPDGTLRMLTVVDGQAVIGRQQGDVFIGEAVLDEVALAADLVGMWQGSQVMVQTGSHVWLLELNDGS